MAADRLHIVMAQLNATVGAVDANCRRILDAYNDAAARGAQLVVTPELSLVGYPPEDLVLKPFFQRTVSQALNALAAKTGDVGLVVGLPWAEGDKLYNAVALLEGGRVTALRFKHELPNYGVFDEKRIFSAGPLPDPIEFRGIQLGAMICEDMWFSRCAAALKDRGAEILIVPTCSPFEAEKFGQRQAQALGRVSENGLPLVFCNQFGGQDELVFEGASFALDADGQTKVQAPAWQEALCSVILVRHDTGWDAEEGEVHRLPDDSENLYQAGVLGVRDYVEKNRFPGVVIGLSGGIDSALTAAIAVDALGAERVHTVMMPSRYTSEESLDDAKACAEALGIRYDIIAIEDAVDAFSNMLGPMFDGRDPDLTEENIQSRIRGVTLMAISNKFGGMVLTTGNKSEVSVGYSTLYGDMCGGYNPLKDMYKTEVFALSEWRNRVHPDGAKGPAGVVIPQRIITKPPTAELRPDQRDDDSLPPYDRLDEILSALVDREESVADLVARGFDEAEVARVEHLLYIAEYKRRQAAPGVKITSRSFGRDRRYPITNGFRSARGAK